MQRPPGRGQPHNDYGVAMRPRWWRWTCCSSTPTDVGCPGRDRRSPGSYDRLTCSAPRARTPGAPRGVHTMTTPHRPKRTMESSHATQARSTGSYDATLAGKLHEHLRWYAGRWPRKNLDVYAWCASHGTSTRWSPGSLVRILEAVKTERRGWTHTAEFLEKQACPRPSSGASGAARSGARSPISSIGGSSSSTPKGFPNAPSRRKSASPGGASRSTSSGPGTSKVDSEAYVSGFRSLCRGWIPKPILQAVGYCS